MYESLKWNFGPGSSGAYGPNDSMITTFKGNKYHSLAREVIQNSLDAVLDRTKPVRVEFSLFELGRDELPSIFEIEETIDRCQQNFSNVAAFNKFCDAAKTVLSEPSITCMRIGDYNTKGLEYGDGQTAFFAFMQAVGFTQKATAGAGGSFGFGKGAYYAASVLRTLMVSSVYGETSTDFVFQGKTRLTTHYDAAGEKKDYIGLFGGDDETPILDPNSVPKFFRREERGTDVILLGFDDNEHTWREHLIKSVLNNFWLAILDNNLVVEVDGILIDSANIERLSEELFDQSDDGKASDPETWNPLPYLRAVKYQGSVNHRVFNGLLPTLGKVTLYVYLGENLPNRTVYLRSPKMTVYKRGRNRAINYVAVFVCDDETGNIILREMENPEHNEWKKTNFLDGDAPHRSAVAAESELRSFVSDSLDQLQSSEAGSRHHIWGLDEYLSIPEDLLPDQDGEGNHGADGKETDGEATEDETAIESTRKNEDPVKLKIPVRKPVVPQPTSGDPTSGDEDIFAGGLQGGDGPPPEPNPGPTPGDEPSKGSTDGDKPIRRPIHLRQRVVAQRGKEGQMIHLVKLFSDEVTVADIEFLAGVDNDTSGDESLVVKEALMNGRSLSIGQRGLCDVVLDGGANILMVQFDSDQKYALRIKSYEV